MKILAILIFCLNIFAADEEFLTIINEYSKFRGYIDTLEPDYITGGIYNTKEFGDTKLMWKLVDKAGEHEIIRFFRRKGDGKYFTVTYHAGDHMVRDTLVIRRFIGEMPSRWRADTISLDHWTYLGSQGSQFPLIEAEDQSFLEEWGISLL